MEENKYDKLASAEKINGDILKYLAACVTLAQGLDRNGFYNFIDVQSEKNTWLAELSNNDAEIYFNALHLSRNHLTYDSVKNKNSPMNICDLRPIEPDVIGEAFILKQLSLRRAKDTPLACHSIFNEAVVQVIIRIIQDFSELHDENHPTDKNVKKRAELPLNWLENIINQSKDDIHKLTQIASAFPSRSIALTDIALKVHKVIRQSLVAKNPDAFMPDLAVSLNNLTILLRENGNVPHALENAFEGLRICRFLYCSS